MDEKEDAIGVEMIGFMASWVRLRQNMDVMRL